MVKPYIKFLKTIYNGYGVNTIFVKILEIFKGVRQFRKRPGNVNENSVN